MREVRKLERAELKKIAAQRLAYRKRQRKQSEIKKATAALIPKAPDGTVVVDPVRKELARRVLMRRRLIEFVKGFHPRYDAGWVHHDICQHLEQFSRDVADRKSPRLMILMPPRHGKSQIASKMFPAWHLGHYPIHEFIACSYNIDLARDFSREVRDILRSKAFHNTFENARLHPDFQSAETWRLDNGSGGYVAAGIKGGITGKGAHVLVIDDPIKNDAEADEKDNREKIWNWYQATAYTRLAPGGGILLIQTCWHDDDLAGKLITEMKSDTGADQWKIVRYAAIAEEDEQYRLEGEALHPTRYDYDALMRIKRIQAPRFWSALYQQNPVPDEGAFFTKDMFVWRDQDLDYKSMRIIQAWDLAISTDQASDYTVGITLGQDYDDMLHVLDMIRFRSDSGERISDSILNMYERWQDKGIGMPTLGVEDGQIWKSLKTEFARRCRERRIYPTMSEPLKPLTDKQVRAGPTKGRMQLHKVTFPKQGGFIDALVRELLRFPSGEHDDTVDALAWAVRVALSVASPARPKPAPSKRELTVAQRIARLGRGGERSHMAA